MDGPDNPPLALALPLPLPRRFGDYILLERLGAGGMGEVWLAKQEGFAGIDKLCVVKSIRASLGDDAEYRERFVDEARVVVDLSHRNIGHVFDIGSVSGALYLAMEHIAGRDLKQLIARVGALPEPIALFILGEVLDALDYAHRRADPATRAPLGLVHRDVSPANIMISFEGETKLIDFGLARARTRRYSTEPGVVLGKLAYMSTEQASGAVVDARTDQFAAGVVGYEMLTGERYFAGVSQPDLAIAVAGGTHRPQRLDGLRAPVRAVLERALSADPLRRFDSCDHLRRALLDVQMAAGTVATLGDVRGVVATAFPGDAAADAQRNARLAAQPVPAPAQDPATIRIAQTTTLARVDTRDLPVAADVKALAEAPTVVIPRSERRSGSLPAAGSSDAAQKLRSGSLPAAGSSDAAQKLRSGSLPAAGSSGGGSPALRAPPIIAVALAAVVVVAALVVLRPSAPLASAEPTAAPAEKDTPQPPIAPVDDDAPPPVEELAPTPPANATTTTKAPLPKKRPPVAVPRMLDERVKYLRTYCVPLASCARPVAARYKGYAKMSADNLAALGADVDACIAECRRK